MSNPNILIITVKKTNNKEDNYCVFGSIDMEIILEKGLISEAIVGIFRGKYSKDNHELIESFTENKIFKDLMHEVIEKYTPHDIYFQKELKRQKNGWIYIIDKRCKDPNGQVLSHDIIGAFEIKNSKVITYKANKNHHIYTKNGFFILPKNIEEKLGEIILSKY